MNITNMQKNEKPLLARIEVTADISYENVTPSKEELRTKLAENLKTDKELVVVKKINNRFGARDADATAYVYKTNEDLLRIEPKKKEKKGAEAKQEGAQEAPKEQKKAEQEKKPEKKEEKPKEEKKTEKK